MSDALTLLLLCSSVAVGANPAYFRPPNHGGKHVIAHRGVHGDIPENTLPAYEKAIEIGADFVEIDLRTTKDGQLVSIHDRQGFDLGSAYKGGKGYGQFSWRLGILRPSSVVGGR